MKAFPASVLLFAMFLVLGSSAAVAREDDVAVQMAPGVSGPAPDVSGLLFFQNLKNLGATFYYLGKENGLHGWVAVKDQQIQLLYTPLNNKGVFIASMLAADGTNISEKQLANLGRGKPEVQKLLQSAGQPAIMPFVVKLGNLPGVGLTRQNTPLPKIDMRVSKHEQIYADVQRAAQIIFGKEGLPRITMILDVNDSKSKEFWKDVEPLLESGKVQVVIVPMSLSRSQSDSDAANWTDKKDPYEAWKRHLAGERDILRTGKPSPEREDVMNATTLLMINRWGIKKLPYFIYQTKQGKTVLVERLPLNMSLFMENLLVPTAAGKSAVPAVPESGH